jgi:hypothetical protein
MQIGGRPPPGQAPATLANLSPPKIGCSRLPEGHVILNQDRLAENYKQLIAWI